MIAINFLFKIWFPIYVLLSHFWSCYKKNLRMNSTRFVAIIIRNKNLFVAVAVIPWIWECYLDWKRYHSLFSEWCHIYNFDQNFQIFFVFIHSYHTIEGVTRNLTQEFQSIPINWNWTELSDKLKLKYS